MTLNPLAIIYCMTETYRLQLRHLLQMTTPVFQRNNTHYAYVTELKDMQSYMKLKIPATRNVTKTRLVTSQPTQKLSLTQLHDDKLLSVVYVSFSP
jgi:hypothetical protein